jgi:hypothetical protein
MYVATQSDKDWLRSEQRKLYARSWDEPGYVWRKLWGLVTDRATCGSRSRASPPIGGHARQAWTGRR